MLKNKGHKVNEYGDEVPRLKDFLLILAVILVLTVISWVGYYKFHWFH